MVLLIITTILKHLQKEDSGSDPAHSRESLSADSLLNTVIMEEDHKPVVPSTPAPPKDAIINMNPSGESNDTHF